MTLVLGETMLGKQRSLGMVSFSRQGTAPPGWYRMLAIRCRKLVLWHPLSPPLGGEVAGWSSEFEADHDTADVVVAAAGVRLVRQLLCRSLRILHGGRLG